MKISLSNADNRINDEIFERIETKNRRKTKLNGKHGKTDTLQNKMSAF